MGQLAGQGQAAHARSASLLSAALLRSSNLQGMCIDRQCVQEIVLTLQNERGKRTGLVQRVSAECRADAYMRTHVHARDAHAVCVRNSELC